MKKCLKNFGTFGSEVGLSQVMIAIDPGRFNTMEQTDEIADQILADLKTSEPIDPARPVLYPGERVAKAVKENRELGIPVSEEVWEAVKAM